MRRVGVGPWVASVTAATLVLFGAGEENIQWAFQIGWVMPLMFGLAHLILADHGGPLGRRDVAGLVMGLLAMLCSTIGVFMVAAVGLATVLRRGWRVAMFHTVPIAVVFLIWYVIVDPRGASLFGSPTPGVVWDWVREGQKGVFESLGQSSLVALALAAVLVGGLWLAWGRLSWKRFRRIAGIPLALGIGSPLFFAVTAQGRWWFGVEFARSSRYLYIATVLILPALAVAVDAISRRWSKSEPFLLVLLLVGVPGNIDLFGASVFSPEFFRYQRETILGIAYTDEIDQVPPWVRFEPNVFNGLDLTAGGSRRPGATARSPSRASSRPGARPSSR